MYHLLALLRLLHREIYLLGPGIVPAVLSKYRTGCAWLIALLCIATALLDLAHARRLGALLWAASGAVLFAGFQSDARLWGSSTTVALAWTAIALALLAIIITALRDLQGALASARQQRHAYRRIQPEPTPTHPPK